MYLKAIGLVAIISLNGCGGSGGGTPSGASGTKEVTHNVVLSTNGALISSSYNDVSSKYIADGDSTTSNFWAGNIPGDNLVIDFGQTAKLSDVSVYTSNTSYNTSNPAIKVELSTDKQTWKRTMNPYGASDVSCSTWAAGEGKLFCVFSAEESARYMRVITNDGSVRIHEVEATGTVKVSSN
jgi:hypothetical protein